MSIFGIDRGLLHQIASRRSRDKNARMLVEDAQQAGLGHQRNVERAEAIEAAARDRADRQHQAEIAREDELRRERAAAARSDVMLGDQRARAAEDAERDLRDFGENKRRFDTSRQDRIDAEERARVAAERERDDPLSVLKREREGHEAEAKIRGIRRDEVGREVERIAPMNLFGAAEMSDDPDFADAVRARQARIGGEAAQRDQAEAKAAKDAEDDRLGRKKKTLDIEIAEGNLAKAKGKAQEPKQDIIVAEFNERVQRRVAAAARMYASPRQWERMQDAETRKIEDEVKAEIEREFGTPARARLENPAPSPGMGGLRLLEDRPPAAPAEEDLRFDGDEQPGPALPEGDAFEENIGRREPQTPTELLADVLMSRPYGERLAMIRQLQAAPEEARRRRIDLAELEGLLS